MRVLSTGDWHGDWITMGVQRFNEVESAAFDTAHAAIAHRVDLFAFLGDLCDPDSGVGVFRCVNLALRISRLLTEHKIPQVWIAGNHCVIEDGSGDTVLTPLAALEHQMLKVFERPGACDLFGGLRVVALPFTATSHAYEPADVLKEHMGGDVCLVLSHLAVPMVQPGEETTDMNRGREVRFPVEKYADMVRAGHGGVKRHLVLQGHYHRRQQLVLPGDVDMLIPGSVARLTFTEEPYRPGYIIAEV